MKLGHQQSVKYPDPVVALRQLRKELLHQVYFEEMPSEVANRKSRIAHMIDMKLSGRLGGSDRCDAVHHESGERCQQLVGHEPGSSGYSIHQSETVTWPEKAGPEEVLPDGGS